MTDHSLRLGRVRGIEISVHWSWLIIFILLTWSLATVFYPPLFPSWSTGTRWAVGAVSSLLLFVSVLMHELSHSLVAQSEGIPVSNITLFVFGGVSNIQREPPTAKAEFLMAAAGPATSLAIAAVAYALLSALDGYASGPVRGILLALAFYNVSLAVFNLIPGFPLDGGRVFRAIVWGVTRDFRRATTIATTVGHAFAFLFIFGGLLLALNGAFLSGIWLLFIGWFLNNAASISQRQAELETILGGISVRAVLREPPAAVPPNLTLSEFVEHYVLARNLRALPVVSADDRLLGLITLSDVRSVPRHEWSTLTVGEVMRPTSRLKVATPDEPLVQALRDLSSDDINQLPVVDHGRLVGLLSRGDVMRYLRVREELGQQAA